MGTEMFTMVMALCPITSDVGKVIGVAWGGAALACTWVSRLTSLLINLRRVTSEYPRVTVPTVTPSSQARSRCVGRRVPCTSSA